MKYQNHVTIEDLKLMLVASSKFKNRKINNFIFSDSSKNYIYREFEKKDEKFIATNNFFISEEIDDGNIEYIQYNNNMESFAKINFRDIRYRKTGYDIKDEGMKISRPFSDPLNIKITPYLKNNNIYVNDNNSEKYFKLIVLSNIEFHIDEININKNEIIKRFIDNDISIDEDFFEDLYYNDLFSKKINIELPDKYKFKNKNINVILDKENISIKYLFRIEFNELTNEYNNEMFQYSG